MIRFRFGFALLGLALILMTTSAEADVMVTLTEDGTSVSATQSGNAFVSTQLSVGNYTFTIETAFTVVGNGVIPGQLASTSIIGTTTGNANTNLDPLTITVQAVNPGGGLEIFNSSSAENYSVLNSASVTSGPSTLSLVGSSQFDANDTGVAPVTVNGIGSGTNTAAFSNATGYMLATTYTGCE